MFYKVKRPKLSSLLSVLARVSRFLVFPLVTERNLYCGEVSPPSTDREFPRQTYHDCTCNTPKLSSAHFSFFSSICESCNERQGVREWPHCQVEIGPWGCSECWSESSDNRSNNNEDWPQTIATLSFYYSHGN